MFVIDVIKSCPKALKLFVITCDKNGCQSSILYLLQQIEPIAGSWLISHTAHRQLYRFARWWSDIIDLRRQEQLFGSLNPLRPPRQGSIYIALRPVLCHMYSVWNKTSGDVLTRRGRPPNSGEKAVQAGLFVQYRILPSNFIRTNRLCPLSIDSN